MRIRNIRHGAGATWRLVATALTLAAGVAAHPITAHCQIVADSSVQPDAGDVVATYLELRRWVDAFAPPEVSSPEARLPLRGAEGVCVILRRHGRVIGSGVAVRARLEEPETMARRAIGRALAEVLGDPAVAPLPESMRDQVGRALTLELDVAGTLQPLPGRTYEQLARQLRPGLDGIALRRGSEWAMVFPAQLRATGSVDRLPGRIAALASELGLPAAEMSTLVDQHGASAYRFGTVHLAQDTPTGQPFETMRGDRVVPLSAVSRDGLAAFADDLAGYLMRSLWPAPASAPAPVPQNEVGPIDVPDRKALGLRGTYHPLSDSYQPLVAPPLEQALGAWALARYAASSHLNDQQRSRALDGAQRILRDLAVVESGEDAPRRDPAACAAIVYAIAALPGSHRAPEIEALMAEAAARVRSAFDPEEGFIVEDEDIGARRALGPHSQSMIAGALARLAATRHDDDLDHMLIRAAIDAAWRAAPEHQQVGLLPWIGLAELDLAETMRAQPAGAERLRELRRVLDRSRTGRHSPYTAEPDLAGGFVLASSGAGEGWPTAQTTRPACMLAVMLREPALTSHDERSEAVVNQLMTMRFLMQLAVRDELTWSYRNAERARGGLRDSLWSPEIAPSAQSLGLIAAVETLRSLESSGAADKERGAPSAP